MPLVEQPLLLALSAFALGIAVGRFWASRTRRRDSRSIGGEAATHYIAGIDFLVTAQIDRAVEELALAAKLNPEAPEIYLILGNLLREKGQLERAIQIHQSILQRPGLSAIERTHALLSLGMDFRRAGFRNRAMDTFKEVITLQPDNIYALLNLRKIYEEDHEWQQALTLQQRIAELTGSRQNTILAFLYDELGQQAAKDNEQRQAERHFETAIRTNNELAPPYLHLAKLLCEMGRDDEAIERLTTLIEQVPDKAYLAFEALEQALMATGSKTNMEPTYRRVIERSDNDWRARVALARHYLGRQQPERAARLLLEALERNPHALLIHFEWLKLVRQGADELAGSELNDKYLESFSQAVIFWDAHRCVKCSYRANGMVWRCPHCQEWNSFVEERLDTRSSEPVHSR